MTKNLKNAFLVVLKLGYLLIFQNLFRWFHIIIENFEFYKFGSTCHRTVLLF